MYCCDQFVDLGVSILISEINCRLRKYPHTSALSCKTLGVPNGTQSQVSVLQTMKLHSSFPWNTFRKKTPTNRVELPQWSDTHDFANKREFPSVNGQRLICILSVEARTMGWSRSLPKNRVFALLVLVDYILMDPLEKKRLFIESIPRMFPQRVIRAPVPWHSTYRNTKKWNEEHLHTVNPMMLILKNLWFEE